MTRRAVVLAAFALAVPPAGGFALPRHRHRQAQAAPRGGLAVARPHLRVQPTTVVAGAKLMVTGSNFKRNELVKFYVGPPRAGADYWGSTRAGRKGGFRKAFRISPRVGAGSWVVVACQRDCRIKATASFKTRRASGRG